MSCSSLDRSIALLSIWTIVLLPALAMWVPLGAEVWLLLVLLAMLSAFVLGWRPAQKRWLSSQKLIVCALLAIVGFKATSLLWSTEPALTWHHVKLHFHLLLYAPLVILFSQIENAHQIFLRKALSLAIFPGAIWAVYVLYQDRGLLDNFDFSGATKNSLILAIFLTYVLCNLAFAYIQSRNKIYLFLILLALFVIFVNGKRSIILNTALVFFSHSGSMFTK